MSATHTLPYESATDPAPTTHPLSLLPQADTLSRRERWIGIGLAVLLSVAYFAYIIHYWAPAHPGVDQNGYLVGGRLLAATGSTGMKPEHDLGFIGAMWVRNDETGYSYPKYPIGIPLLFAIPLWIFGSEPDGIGVRAAFLVSPVGAAVAALGTYFLARQFVGLFGALCAMLLLMFSQLTLSLANNPNSHAACLATVVWGIYLLLRFWETGAFWRGLLGGFLIGFAYTIRYTEGLLGLLVGVTILCMAHAPNARWRSPTTVGIVRLFTLPFTHPKAFLRLMSPLVGWLIPVAYLTIFNLIAMGTPTGYDTTNESKPGSAFTIEHITQNWEKLIRQVHDTALFFALPLAMLGMLLAFRNSTRRALLLWLWLLPGVLIYMSYYWAPDRGVSYLRFFLTLLPPLVVGAGVVVDQVQHLAAGRMQRVFLPIGAGLVVAMACALGLYRSILGLDDGVETGMGLESQFRQNANLAQVGEMVVRHAKPGATIISNTNELHYLQFLGDYECFSTETFTVNFVNRLRSMEQRVDADNDPMTQQPARRRFLLSKLDGKDEAALTALQAEIIRERLDAGRRVFLVLNADAMRTTLQRLKRADPTLNEVLRDSYKEFGRLRPQDADATPQQQADRRPPMGPGGGNRNTRRGFGGGGGPPGGMGRLPQTFQIVELTRSAPPPPPPPPPARVVSEPARPRPVEPPPRRVDPPPTTRPAVRPTTRPATPPPTTQASPEAVEERLRQRRARREVTPTTAPASQPSATRPVQTR